MNWVTLSLLWVVPTENLIRRFEWPIVQAWGRRTTASVRIADLRSLEVDGWLAYCGRSSGRRGGVHGRPAPAVSGSRQAA